MKLIIPLLLLAGICKGQRTPCPKDTINGILIWHDPKDYGNDGSKWDNGHWVGKCGPLGYMPLEKIIFFPGIWKCTEYTANANRNNWHIENKIYIQSGIFYDSEWKKVPAEDVYGMIIIR